MDIKLLIKEKLSFKHTVILRGLMLLRISLYRLCNVKNKEEILHYANASFRMTPYLSTLEIKGKGLPLSFRGGQSPEESLRKKRNSSPLAQNDRKMDLRMTGKEVQKDNPFFCHSEGLNVPKNLSLLAGYGKRGDSSLTLRITEKGQNNREADEILLCPFAYAQGLGSE